MKGRPCVNEKGARRKVVMRGRREKTKVSEIEKRERVIDRRKRDRQRREIDRREREIDGRER